MGNFTSTSSRNFHILSSPPQTTSLPPSSFTIYSLFSRPYRCENLTPPSHKPSHLFDAQSYQQPWRKKSQLSSLTMVPECARPVSPVMMLPELCSHPLLVVLATMVS